MTHTPIRILVVDDHVMVRQGIRALLTEYEDVEVVGEAANGVEAVQAAESLKPDVIMMDLIMLGMDGVEATRRISAQWPEACVLVVTRYSGDDLVFPAIKAGARGYVLKDAGARELVGAIRQVHRGEPSLHPDIARKLLQEVRNPTPDRRAPDPLTAREVEVLRLLAEGLDNTEIAERLVVAEVTVRSHISRILDKLHVANRVQATLYALREGLADLEQDP